MRSRSEICSGLHDVAQRRSWRRGLLRPFHGLNAGPADRASVGPTHVAGQSLLHVLAQPLVGGELGRLRPPRARARPSTAPPTPGTRAGRRASPRCAATRARSSTATGPAAARSHARPSPRHATARSPPARRTTGTDPRPRRRSDRASRHPPETTGRQPPATPRPRAPPPRCAGPSRSHARTALDLAPVRRPAPATSSPTGPSTPSSTPPACPSQLLCIKVLRRPLESALAAGIGVMDQLDIGAGSRRVERHPQARRGRGRCACGWRTASRRLGGRTRR